VQKNETNTAMHQSVNTAKGNTHPNQKKKAGEERIIPPSNLEIREEHLKVHGAPNRNRDAATGKGSTQ
jgi:hypothetical protein